MRKPTTAMCAVPTPDVSSGAAFYAHNTPGISLDQQNPVTDCAKVGYNHPSIPPGPVKAGSFGGRFLSTGQIGVLLLLSDRTARDFIKSNLFGGERSAHHYRILSIEIEHLVRDACTRAGIQCRPLQRGALMTVRDAANVLPFSLRLVRLRAEIGELPGFKIGRAWRFWREDIEAELARISVGKCRRN